MEVCSEDGLLKSPAEKKPRIALVCKSIHDYSPASATARAFDVVYFSGSFMIIPNQVLALKRCMGFLKEANSAATNTPNILFTQTFEKRGMVGSLMRRLKPLFKYILTIDFGEVTFEEDFLKVCEEAGVKVLEIETIRATAFRKEVLVRARPL